MTTADWAFVVSLFSAAISLAGLFWNVWSKFIYPKAKVRVTCGMYAIVMAGKPEIEVISLNATNLGPTEITLQSVIVRGPRPLFKKKRKIGIMSPIDDIVRMTGNGPFGGGLPRKMAVGETYSAYFPPGNDQLATGPFREMGFLDSFGRLHFAPKREFNKLIEDVKEWVTTHPNPKP